MGLGRTIWILDILDHKLAFFRPPFKFLTIWQPDTNLLFEYQTSLVFRCFMYKACFCNLQWDLENWPFNTGHFACSICRCHKKWRPKRPVFKSFDKNVWFLNGIRKSNHFVLDLILPILIFDTSRIRSPLLFPWILSWKKNSCDLLLNLVLNRFYF